MSAAFTPGPWEPIKCHPGTATWDVRGEDGKAYAAAWTEANARLIAAAPELYEAARIADQLALIASDWNLSEVEIDGEMQSIYDVRDIFAAALAKARGEQ